MQSYRGYYIYVEYSSRRPRPECWRAYYTDDSAYDDNEEDAIKWLKAKIDQRFDLKPNKE